MNSDIPTFSSPEEETAYWKNQALQFKKTLEETRDELEEFQTSSRELETELEAQLEQQERRSSELRQQVNKIAFDNQILKERLEKEQSEFCSQLSRLQQELSEIKAAKESLIKYVREIEQANDDLERAKRATVTSLEDFETRLNMAIERNAFLESELDEKDALKDVVQRLKDEARDLRQDVSVTKRDENLRLTDNDEVMRPPSPTPTKQVSQIAPPQITCHNCQKQILHNGSTHTPLFLHHQHNIQQQQFNGNCNNTVDSNKLVSESENINKNAKCGPLLSPVGGVPPMMTPSSRISALNIVGDLLRKVGALESRLASCRTLVKDGQRPISMPPQADHSNAR